MAAPINHFQQNHQVCDLEAQIQLPPIVVPRAAAQPEYHRHPETYRSMAFNFSMPILGFVGATIFWAAGACYVEYLNHNDEHPNDPIASHRIDAAAKAALVGIGLYGLALIGSCGLTAGKSCKNAVVKFFNKVPHSPGCLGTWKQSFSPRRLLEDDAIGINTISTIAWPLLILVAARRRG